jgi:3-oxoacyl-[acyl-carrier-protein] synthase III
MKALFHDIYISRIAAILPENILELSSLASEYGETEVSKIMRTTGIKRVHYVSQHITSSDLCEQLAKKLFSENASLHNEIDGLIFVSQTPDHRLPQTSIILQSKLGLSTDTVCFDLPLGCSGYVYGLFQAAMLLQSGACKKVLILAGDTTTKMLNKKDRTVTMVFGDAASATILEKGKTSAGFIIRSDGSGAKDLIVPAGGYRLPASVATKQLQKFEGDIYRSQEDLFMDGMQILNFSLRAVPSIVKDSLEQMQWRQDDVNSFILHQANEFMVSYLRKKMKLTEEKVPIAVENYGNTGPSSIPLTLSDKFSNNNGHLKKILMCGFGVGLSWATCCADLSETIIEKPIIYQPA